MYLNFLSSLQSRILALLSAMPASSKNVYYANKVIVSSVYKRLNNHIMNFLNIQQLVTQYNIKVSLIDCKVLAAFLKYKHVVELVSIYFDKYFIAVDVDSNYNFWKKNLFRPICIIALNCSKNDGSLS